MRRRDDEQRQLAHEQRIQQLLTELQEENKMIKSCVEALQRANRELLEISRAATDLAKAMHRLNTPR